MKKSYVHYLSYVTFVSYVGIVGAMLWQFPLRDIFGGLYNFLSFMSAPVIMSDQNLLDTMRLDFRKQ